MPTKIVNVSELKANLAALMAALDAQGVPVYVTQHGKPRAVLVKYEEYEELLERLDDLEDVVAMHQAASSPEEEAVSLAAYELGQAATLRG